MTHDAPAGLARRIAATVAAVALVAACTAGSATPDRLVPDRGLTARAGYGTTVNCANPPAVVAHRGGNEAFTENTLGAFQSANDLAAAKVWETDLRFDVNDVPVILHDDTVDRVSDETGAIADLVAAGSHRIKTLDGQQIPTLWEVLNQAETDGARVLLELKVMPANAAQWANLWNRIDITVGRPAITLASFDTATLAAVRSRSPGIRTALISQSGDLTSDQVLAQGQSIEKYDPSMTKDKFTRWTASGIEIFAWTVDDPTLFNREVGYPVAGIITDKPLAYRAWLDTQCPGVTVRTGITPPAKTK